MSGFRYRARRVRYEDGRPLGWGVYLEPAGRAPSMMAGFTGRLAWWRARYRAAVMNRRLA